jgi:formylmethanofuran dehydrogenase subunit E
MALFMYSSINSKHYSTQAYLGSVSLCPMCKGQKPKETFKIVDGESICKDCQDELEQEEL